MGEGALLPFYLKRGIAEDYSKPLWKRSTAWVALILPSLRPHYLSL